MGKVVLSNTTAKQKIVRRQSKGLQIGNSRNILPTDAKCETQICPTEPLFTSYNLYYCYFCILYSGSEIPGGNRRNRKQLDLVQTVTDCGQICAFLTWLHACCLNPDCIRKFTAVRLSSVTHKPLYFFTLPCRASSGSTRKQDLTIKYISGNDKLALFEKMSLKWGSDLENVSGFPVNCGRAWFEVLVNFG